ncbi:PKD domain-containing protein [Neobacillus drentensis]|uniref:PKD domain-containing protein n=1 Tax=Neobacillus drentensis TaxID=220684 RepID=UPI0030013CA3
MESRKIKNAKQKISNRRKSAIKRLFLVTLTVLITLSGSIFWAEAETVPMDFPRLAKVGPIHEDNGYPVWYKDSKGTRLQLCLDVNDPLCALDPAEIPNPAAPISLKNGNFPVEAFYQLASSTIDLPNGGRAVATFALEAAWANEIAQDGDQIVFGRVRLRVDGLVTGKEYTITHPYGVDKFVAVEEDEDTPTVGEVRFVEDIGISGGFEAAKKSRIGTFLEWDKGAPEGYIGDPNVDHKITGGINNQNMFKIEGPGIGKGAPVANQCPVKSDNCIQTDLFSLMGKKATTAGVDIARATYSRTTDGGTIDVFASTEEEKAQTIEVKGVGIDPVVMEGSSGQYFTRVAFSGTTPNITVTNTSDNPDSVKTITPVDKITATATYEVNSKTLVITAASSDQVASPILTVSGFKQTVPQEGLTMKNPSYVPPNITVTSSKNGTVTVPVTITDVPVAPAPVANAGTEQTVQPGSDVTLHGANTGGEVTSILWEQVSPVAPKVELTGANTLNPTFKAPAEGGEFLFKLTLTGPAGTSMSTVKVIVTSPITDPVPTPLANAGADQSVKQNTVVTLDGSTSTDATTYTWKQTGGTNVTLNLTNPAKPTFTAPKKMENLTFELTAIGAEGKKSTDEVTISTQPDKLTVTTAEYRKIGKRWTINGTSDIFGPGVKVSIYIGDAVPANLLTSVNVNNRGAFTFTTINSAKSIVQGGTLTLVSTSGGKLTNVAVTVK